MNPNLCVSKCFCYLLCLALVCFPRSESSSEPEQFSEDQSDQPETGLEFIPDNFQLIDEDFYIGENAFSAERFLKLSPLELVRMFIRELKGIPKDFQTNSKLDGSGEKPAWSYYPYRLKKLAEIELNIYGALRRYSQEVNSFPVLESYLKDVEQTSRKLLASFLVKGSENQSHLGVVDGEHNLYLYIATHPLLVYRMIRRFAEDLKPILSELVNGEDYLRVIYQADKDVKCFPTIEDLEDALDSLERTQTGSNLKTEEFANGIFENLNTGTGLNALHALEIGAYLVSRAKYDYAIEWLSLAKKKVSSSPKAHKFPLIRTFFSRVFEYAINQHNEQWPLRHTDEWNPDVFNAIVNSSELSSYQRMFDILKDKSAVFSERIKAYWNWNVPINFIQVCSGVNLQTLEEKRKLNCFYLQNANPYWYINPLKIELLSSGPPVVQIYEFCGEKRINDIKAAAVGGLRRSKVVDPDEPLKSKVDKARTSSQVWLYDEQPSGQFLLPFSKQLELLTGVVVVANSIASDAYQVATYGSSHHYEPHLDALEDPKRCVKKGNRILTIMGYLSDVTVGGRTGFPVLGTFADPVKGSLVIWENLMHDVENPDERTTHGGCPVVLGVKWISNKWIYSKANVFKYPCPVNARGKTYKHFSNFP